MGSGSDALRVLQGSFPSSGSSLTAEDSANVRKQRRELHVLESMYCKARQHGDIVTSCAVTYFRTQALKDAHHPDFLGDWI